MKRCYECDFRGELPEETTTHLLDDLFEVAASVARCPKCGAEYTGLNKIEPLYDAVARDLADETRRLAPEELRWLRKYLGYSSEDLAEYLGVTRQTISRWENQAGSMPVAAELLLRFMAKRGPAVETYPLEEREREVPRFRQNSRGDWVRQ